VDYPDRPDPFVGMLYCCDDEPDTWRRITNLDGRGEAEVFRRDGNSYGTRTISSSYESIVRWIKSEDVRLPGEWLDKTTQKGQASIPPPLIPNYQLGDQFAYLHEATGEIHHKWEITQARRDGRCKARLLPSGGSVSFSDATLSLYCPLSLQNTEMVTPSINDLDLCQCDPSIPFNIGGAFQTTYKVCTKCKKERL
jgi:hypothetical protein